MKKEITVRIFKFRAWHQKSNRMILVHGFHTDYVFEDTMDGADVGKNILPTCECELMQFSGMQDKEGVGIFDGDIVAGYATKHGVPFTPTKGKPIVFKDGCFQWGGGPLGYDMDTVDGEGPTPYCPSKWALVIGNIYENPEMI